MTADLPIPRAGTTAPRAAVTALNPGAHRQAQSEDDLLAFLLIHTWMLSTGRILRSDVPPAYLSEDELITFWADDHITPSTG